MDLTADLHPSTTLSPNQTGIINLLNVKGPLTLVQIRTFTARHSNYSVAALLERGLIRKTHTEVDGRTVAVFSLAPTKRVQTICEKISKVRGLVPTAGIVIGGVPTKDPSRHTSLS
jgi:uncharacterized protein YceH (UPF0502 family)